MITELGFSEVDKEKPEYKTEYFQMRASEKAESGRRNLARYFWH